MSATTSAVVSGDFVIPMDAPKLGATEAIGRERLEKQDFDYLSSGFVRETIADRRLFKRNYLERVSTINDPVQATLPLKKPSVNGSVVDLNDTSVKCELYLDRGIVNVILPRIFFPKSIKYGAPISIAMDEAEGIRKPIISVREVDKAALEKENEEIAKLVQALEA